MTEVVTTKIIILIIIIIIITIIAGQDYYPLIIMKGYATSGTVTTEETVLQVHAGLTNQVIGAHKVMVKHIQRELCLQGEGHIQFEHSVGR